MLLKNNQWFINKKNDTSSKISINSKFNSLTIGELIMDYKDEQIMLSGAIKDSTQKDIKLNFKAVDLSKITPAIKDFNFEGILDGNLQIKQRDGIYFPSAAIDIQNLKINKDSIGDFNLAVVGDNSLTKFQIDASVDKLDKCTLEINGDQ